MNAFLQRFYDEVDDNLGDPHSQKRYTKAARYRDLHAIQKRLFERFLALSGQESMIGRSEAEIELVSGKEFYSLPEGFRQFVCLEKRTDGGPEMVEMRLWTIPTYSIEIGIEIITSQRGFRVQPIPDSTMAGTWTLIFNKAPIRLHYATTTVIRNAPFEEQLLLLNGFTYTTTSVTKTGAFTAALVGETVRLYLDGFEDVTREITVADADHIEFAEVPLLDDMHYIDIDVDWCWLVAGTPGTDCGEIVSLPDYYNGSLLRIYSASGGGSPQTKEILDYYADPTTTTEWHFKLRRQWTPLPSGTTSYEICPELPEDYDALYAMDVAMLACSRREGMRRRAGLALDRHDLYEAARNYFANNTIDRQPQRVLPIRYSKPDPYFGGML